MLVVHESKQDDMFEVKRSLELWLLSTKDIKDQSLAKILKTFFSQNVMKIIMTVIISAIKFLLLL